MGLIIVPGQNTKHFLSEGFEWPNVFQSYLPMSSSFEVGSLWSIEEWSSSHWWRTSSEGNTADPWASTLSSEWGYPGSMMPKTLVHLHGNILDAVCMYVLCMWNKTVHPKRCIYTNIVIMYSLPVCKCMYAYTYVCIYYCLWRETLYQSEWISLGSPRGFSWVPLRRVQPRPERSEGAGIRSTDLEDCAPMYVQQIIIDGWISDCRSYIIEISSNGSMQVLTYTIFALS